MAFTPLDGNRPNPPANGPETTGFLLVGHGTRQVAGQQQMRQVFADFAGFVAPYPAELGFLELAEPDIETSVSRLATRGIRQVITVPVLLFTAGHAIRDIPDAVHSACAEQAIDCIGQTPSLQLCRPVVELSARRLRETLCSGSICSTHPFATQPASDPPCVSSCSGRWCSQTGLLMVGRGSNSEEATEAMRAFTAARLSLTPAAWSQTCFIHGQSPTVEQGLDQLAESGQPLAVVQPHLLFEGELIATLRRQVAERAEQNPHQRWLITETLGTDERLGRTLAEVAMEQISCPAAHSPQASPAQ